MKEVMEILCPEGAKNLTDVARAMEQGAIAHGIDLKVDHDRILSDFGCLWMLVRYEISLTRLPVGAFRVHTFLRTPGAAFSLRDFTFFDEKGECGQAVQTWVVADEKERKIRPISAVPPLLEGPVHKPERTNRPRRFKLPRELAPLAVWTVAPEEIDDNGHLNNVAYVRHAETLAPEGCTCLDVSFERECFVGETLTLKGAQTEEGYYVQICKESGEESFRARFLL